MDHKNSATRTLFFYLATAIAVGASGSVYARGGGANSKGGNNSGTRENITSQSVQKDQLHTRDQDQLHTRDQDQLHTQSHEIRNRVRNTAQFRTRIKTLQQALNHHGAKLKIDGIMGARTESALRQFQRANNIPVTGTLNPLTKEKLGLQ